MTSELGAKECYVYITLPGVTEFVTAGRFVLDTDRTGVAVGRFVYGKSDLGRYAHADNLLSQSARFTLNREEAQTVVATMEQRVRDTWYETARRVGVSERDCDKIAGAFVYPEFRQELHDK